MKEAFALFSKLDERKAFLKRQGQVDKIKTPKSRGIEKNELKNFASDLNVVVEGVRSRVKVQTDLSMKVNLTYQ